MTIKAEKSIYIKGGSANAVNGLQGAITLDSKGTTVVDGDILAAAATVSADFKGAGSSLTGAVTTGDTGKTTLGFSDGALWKAEGDSKVSYLTLKGGVVDLNNHDVTAVTLADNSAATIRLDAGAEKLGSFTVENKLSLGGVCRALSENPAKLYGLYPRKGVIAAGSDADIVVYDPGASHVLHGADMLSKAGYTPFEGFRTNGGVSKVYLRGQLQVDGGKVVGGKMGEYLKRGKCAL